MKAADRMANGQDARRSLAERLRDLRTARWPGLRVKQSDLASALGLSVPTISSWESQTSLVLPPMRHLESMASFYASRRSMTEGPPHVPLLDDLTVAEQQAREDLWGELRKMSMAAQRAALPTGAAVSSPLESDLWSFPDGKSIVIVCAELPGDMLRNVRYADPHNPDFIRLYRLADLDSLFELHGHLRAVNPRNQVDLRRATNLTNDDLSSHLVILGGVDWNPLAKSVLSRLSLPVKQVTDWPAKKLPYFEVTVAGETERFSPLLENMGEPGSDGSREVLMEDVALFVRAANPTNRDTTVTICNGMYGNGTYGAVRALTDARFRERNSIYVREHFEGNAEFCILTRVTIVENLGMTPDWTVAENVLFEWSR
jgi:transcriptional regulator with XRE-family HTH domain